MPDPCTTLCTKVASCIGHDDEGCRRNCARNARHPETIAQVVDRCVSLPCDAYAKCYREVMEAGGRRILEPGVTPPPSGSP